MTEGWRARVTEYSVAPLRGTDECFIFELLVAWRGEDSWAVVSHFNRCLARDSVPETPTWEYERSSSNRTDEFLERFRMPLEEAVQQAERHVWWQVVNGRTPAMSIREFHPDLVNRIPEWAPEENPWRQQSNSDN